MSLFVIALTSCGLFLVAYFLYGWLLARWFDLSPNRTTPACSMSDGVDYVPAKAPFLLGQHFSAIAAAGPIVGPILAALWFGWLPALLWIVFGAIFFGAVHDFSSLVGSVRHQARSIVEIVRDNLGPRAHLLFMGFVWLSLVYVIIAFTDLTSASFVEPTYGGGVASSSFLYLLAAVAMGFSLYKLRMPLKAATVVFLPVVGLIIWFGQSIPLVLPQLGNVRSQLLWNGIILSYCFIASILPMWMLLQPRGYLGGILFVRGPGRGCGRNFPRPGSGALSRLSGMEKPDRVSALPDALRHGRLRGLLRVSRDCELGDNIETDKP